MKREIFFKILKLIKSNKNIKKKILIFGLIGIIGIFIISGITFWIGFKAVDYVASRSKEVLQAPIAKIQIEKLNSSLSALDKHQALNCWDTAQGLVGIQVWIENSVANNLMKLRNSCLDNNSLSSQNLNTQINQENKKQGEFYDSGEI